jgi:DNA-binding transcriptional LysR family regulator
MTLSEQPNADLGQLTRKLELDSLRVFAVVCQEGSYSKAARVEPLTASAISKRIAELERAMGCILLERSSYGVRPTAAGELVLSQWSDVAACLQQLLWASDDISVASHVQQMSIVADPAAARFLVFDCLGHVEALDDAAKVTVARSQPTWLAVEYHKLGAHCAVWSLGDAHDSAGLARGADAVFEKFPGARHYRFSAEVCVAVVRDDHPLAPLGLVSADDLDTHEIVCCAGTHDHNFAERVRNTADFAGMRGRRLQLSRPTWSHQVGSALEFLESVPCGAVALLPTSARYLMHRFNGLRCLTMTEDLGCMPFGCALRDDVWLSERLRLVEKLAGCQLHEASTVSPCWDEPQAGDDDALNCPPRLAIPKAGTADAAAQRCAAALR